MKITIFFVLIAFSFSFNFLVIDNFVNAQMTVKGTFFPAVPISVINIEGISINKELDEIVHYVIQFSELPDWLEKQALKDKGIKLTSYIGNNFYFVSSKVSDLKILEEIKTIMTVTEFKPEFKLSSYVKTEKPPPWSISDGDVAYTIFFHKDTDINKNISMLKNLGVKILSQTPLVPSVTASFESTKLESITTVDAVQFIDYAELPLELHNDGARANANVNPLINAPYGLTGNGVTILVFDGGVMDTHLDFGTRIIETDINTPVSQHATHVGGTVGGAGINSNGVNSAFTNNGGTANQWAGMAPGVNFRSFGVNPSTGNILYGGTGDINADFTTAIGNGIDLATMSLGTNAYLWNPPACNRLGDYSNGAILVDNIVGGSINNQQLPFFESVGNERGTGSDGVIATCGTFQTISPPATAKNSIGVGAINSDDNAIASFSSWGPTDDGRIKPDIVASGDQAIGGSITSPAFTNIPNPLFPFQNTRGLDPWDIRNSYVAMSGTSMATPVASGAASLLIEQWRITHGANATPLPHTVKAILIHTVTDLGNPGPDYQFGWGALDANAAVDLVIADDTENLIHVGQVDNDQTDTFRMDSDGNNPIQVTLVWDDPPATALSNPTLINDLDIRLINPKGVASLPFVLNPTNPGNPATNGNDNINNVEMIISPISMAGAWRVTVTGTLVPQGPQEYTLITSESTIKSKCVPLLPYAAHPYFFRQLYTASDIEFQSLIANNQFIVAHTYYQLANNLLCLNPEIVKEPLYRHPPICIDFGDPFDPLGPHDIPYKCTAPDPCILGLQCPEPFDYLRFEFDESILRDVGSFVNGKITDTEFNKKFTSLLESEQIGIRSGSLQLDYFITQEKIIQEIIFVPPWIKTNAGWWSEGQINDDSFVKGIKYLIKEDIMKIPETKAGTGTSQEIPPWIKQNADWWSQGQITDESFVNGVQWLIENGIMRIN